MSRPRFLARRHAVAALVLVLGGAATLAGCTIRPDEAPRDIAAEERGVLEPVDPEAGEAVGASRVFLVDGDDDGRRLRSVLRNVVSSPEPLLRALIAGPNETELDARLTSAIPAGTELHSAQLVGGLLTVDLSPEILNVSGDEFIRAVAQIVATASEIDNVREVRLQVDGENQAWPNGSGEVQDTPLTVYDFPGLVESAQPAFPAVPSG